MCATPSGVYSTTLSARSRSLSASLLHHSAGAEFATPRGSNPTRSNLSRTDSGSVVTIETAALTPDSPGPPGLMTSEPILSPVAGKRIIASWMTSPLGSSALSQLTGTDSSPHSAPGGMRD